MTFINYGEITVAQKLLVDPLAVAGSDVFVGGFRYNVTNNALRVADGTIPAVFHGGLGFTADGRLCVQSGPMAITSYVNGLAMTTTGQVLADTVSPVWHAHGWPISALGKLCVEGVVPPSTAVAHFPGGSGNFIVSSKQWEPINGQCAIEAKIKFTGPAAAWYNIFCASTGQPQVDFALNTVSGFLDLRIVDSIQSVLTLVSSTPPAFNVTPIWVRMLLNTNVINYYSSPDRVTWTPMGGVFSTGSSFTTGNPPPLSINVGGPDSYYGFAGWVGDIGRIQVWNDVAMTQQAWDFDPSKWVSGTTFVSGGDTYTIVGGVTIS
jgi:hypothetical protein